MQEDKIQDGEFNISEYTRIFFRRKWVIISFLIAGAALAFVYNQRKAPVYKATAVFKVEFASSPRSLEDFFFSREKDLQGELKAITSSGVLKETAFRIGAIGRDSTPFEVEEQIKDMDEKIAATALKDTKDLVNLDALSGDPAGAVLLAATIIEVYKEKSSVEKNSEDVEVQRVIENQLVLAKAERERTQEKLRKFRESEKSRNLESKEALQSSLVGLKLQLPALDEKYTESHAYVISMRKQIKVIEDSMKDLPALESELEKIKMDTAMNENEIMLLNQKYKETLISRAQVFSPVAVVRSPMLPNKPVKPNKLMNLLFGIIGGLVAGCMVAAVLENLDTSMGTAEQVEEFLRLPVLGMLPFIYTNEKKSGDPDRDEKNERIVRNLLLHSPVSAFAESYRRFQLNARISGMKDNGKKVILFTSTVSAEGKTFTASNFAVICAQSNMKVLLLDADFRKPAVHQMFGIDREPGLTDLIAENGNAEEPQFRGISGRLNVGTSESAMARENLKVLCAGTIPYNPVSFISSQGFQGFLKKMRDRFDLIILDAPPIMPVSDTILLAELSDAVIMVYQVGKVAKWLLNRAVSQIRKIKTPILGVVLNETKEGAKNKYYYNYYYNYYNSYGYREEGEGRKKSWLRGLKRMFPGHRAKSPEHAASGRGAGAR